MTTTRDDEWALAERWIAIPNACGEALCMMWEPLHRWPEHIRKTFIATLPVSVPLFLVASLGLMTLFCITGLIGFTGARLHYAWRGERSPWG
jgi:hypothetical protein